jgi:hypothetical protein
MTSFLLEGFRVLTTSINAGGLTYTTHGSGLLVGNGLVITAGHVDYLYLGKLESNPDKITIEDFTTFYPTVTAYDPAYPASLVAVAKSLYANPPSSTGAITSQADFANDQALLYRSGTVGSDSDGLAYFNDPRDIPKLYRLLNNQNTGASVNTYRLGQYSIADDGSINLTENAGQFQYTDPVDPNQTAEFGDSGGPYLLEYITPGMGTEPPATQLFDFGVEVGQELLDNPLGIQILKRGGFSDGSYFTGKEFTDLTTIIDQHFKAGVDPTVNRPTNMIVGSDEQGGCCQSNVYTSPSRRSVPKPNLALAHD